MVKRAEDSTGNTQLLAARLFEMEEENRRLTLKLLNHQHVNEALKVDVHRMRTLALTAGDW